MEKIVTPAKMSITNLDCMFFEIILSMKGEKYRARTTSLAKINNIKNLRPEAVSRISYENAIQAVIPKIEDSLSCTNKKLGKVFYDENGKLMFSVETILYNNYNSANINISSGNPQLNTLVSNFIGIINQISQAAPLNNTNLTEISNSISNFIPQNSCPTILEESYKKKVIKYTDVTIAWLQTLLERTKKPFDDIDYLSPNTLEGYNRVLRDFLFPYLEKYPNLDNIYLFNENVIDDIFKDINGINQKRILLIAFKLIFDYAKDNSYISQNPIANKKLKKKKKQKKDYDFIEEEDRAKWINCMLEEIHSEEYENTDAALAFLCTLLHGDRPEETCGTKWIDFDFEQDNYHIQNAYKKIPIYDEVSMKRIGWTTGDGSLKTPESDRHLSLDILFKQLLLEHREKQKKEYRKLGKKWSEKEYVFHNSVGLPFTPDILSKNFARFIKRHNLKHMVIYGLRHSFATHCRNLGVKPEVLAKLMGHTEYETTQKYYIHISQKQKKDALKKVQNKDIQNYLDEGNKDLEHLQNKINTYNKNVENLEQVQKEDINQYLQLDSASLIQLKNLLLLIKQQQTVNA